MGSGWVGGGGLWTSQLHDPTTKTYTDKKVNIFNFGANVTMKKSSLLLNICAFKMKSNLKLFLSSRMAQ